MTEFWLGFLIGIILMDIVWFGIEVWCAYTLRTVPHLKLTLRPLFCPTCYQERPACRCSHAAGDAK